MGKLIMWTMAFVVVLLIIIFIVIPILLPAMDLLQLYSIIG